MSEFSKEIIDCLASWTKELQNCNGEPECIEQCNKELRKRLDIVLPSSTKLEFDNDKISYIFSTIFFLSNRLNKALVGLAVTDKALSNLVSEKSATLDKDIDNKDKQEFHDILNKVLSGYF